MAVRKPVVLVDGQLKELPSTDFLPAANIPEVTAAHIHAATSKTTPADADELGVTDSAASWGLKKLTWATLKATLPAAPAANPERRRQYCSLQTPAHRNRSPSYATAEASRTRRP